LIGVMLGFSYSFGFLPMTFAAYRKNSIRRRRLNEVFMGRIFCVCLIFSTMTKDTRKVVFVDLKLSP